MLKTREDFKSEDEYRAYTKTSDFLVNYSWEGKVKEQIVSEMALRESEQEYLQEAIDYCAALEQFSGMELDRHILLLMDLSDHPEGDKIRKRLKRFSEKKGEV